MFRSTKQRNRALAALVFLTPLLAACSGGDDTGAEPTPTTGPTPEPARIEDLERVVLDAASDGPAGVAPADMDDDGDLDLVVNFFGDRGEDPGPTEFPPGGVTILWNQGDLTFQAESVLTRDDGVYFPNEAHPEDLDGDGDLDILVSAGFFVCEFNRDIGPCGGLFWLEQDGDDWLRHDIVEQGSMAFYHRVERADLDGDGIDDLVTVGELQADARAQWFKGTGEGDLWESEPRTIGQGGGSLPVLHDVDGDGDLDLASGEFFFEGASFAWFEQVEAPTDEDPDGVWDRHVISTELGRTIQLSVIEDLFGDGQDGWVGSNHVPTVTDPTDPPAGIFLLEPGEDPTQPWSSTLLSAGIDSRPTEGVAFQAAPGVFSWGDIDGDGDTDLAVAGDGDDRTFVFEQVDGGFDQHVLDTGFGQAAGGVVVDLDGDGHSEVIFTGYEDNTVVAWTS